jgi:hypothetical protein
VYAEQMPQLIERALLVEDEIDIANPWVFNPK